MLRTTNQTVYLALEFQAKPRNTLTTKVLAIISKHSHKRKLLSPSTAHSPMTRPDPALISGRVTF